MPTVMSMHWPTIKPEQYDAALEKVDWEGNTPDGAIFHVAWFDDDGFHALDLWESADDFNRPLQELITEYAWGAVWSRPGLDRRTRSAITLTALVCLRAENELGMHVRAALRNGLTADEIGEVLLHSAIYAGVPAANAAFAVARRVLAEE